MSRASQVRTIVRNTAYNGLSQAASILSTLVLLPLLVRSFGAVEYGVLVLASSFGGWALLFDFGMSAAVTSRVADASAREDAEETATVIASATAVYTAIGLVWGVVLVALGWLGAPLFGLDGPRAALFFALMAVTAVAQAVYWTGLSTRDALAGLQRFDLIARVALFLVLAEVVGAVAVLTLDASPLMLGAVRGGALAVSGIAYRVVLARTPRSSARPTIECAVGLLKAGAPVFTMQVAQILNKQQTDRLVVGIFLGPAFVTVYEVAAKLASLVVSFMGVLSSAILPVAARLNAQRHDASMRALFERGSHLIALAVAPVTAGLIVIAPAFLEQWGGPSFVASATPARLLLAAQLLVPLYAVGDAILIGKGRFHIWIPGGIVLALLNVALSVALVGRWGVAGVALGTLVAALAEVVWYLWLFAPEVQLPLGRWIRTTALPLYALLLVPCTLITLGLSTPLADSMAGLAVLGVSSVAVYWAVAVALTIPSSMRAELVRSLRRGPAEAS